jgi:hypothetical protein
MRSQQLWAFDALSLQTFALNMPDELTVAHSWKDERKPREYNFDSVFGPGASQDSVSGASWLSWMGSGASRQLGRREQG